MKNKFELLFKSHTSERYSIHINSIITPHINSTTTQSIRQSIADKMPLTVAGITWMDALVSAMSLLMALAVMENVLAEILNEHFTEIVATQLDR
jgi:hypothetical protein